MITAEHLSKQFTRDIMAKEQQSSDHQNKQKRKKNISKKEEFFAVDDISFTVEKGEIVGILGPNGAGKTTLLRMLGTLMEPTKGRVIMTAEDGSIMEDPIAIKQNIGYLSGNTKLFRRISTREMLQMLGEIYGMSKEETEERIGQMCGVLDMGDCIDNRM